MATRKVKGRWFVDFRHQHADGRIERVRKRSPVQSKAGAEEYERQLRTSMLMPAAITKEVPQFSAFSAEFMTTYALSNNKPSEQEAKRCILRHHLLPAFGELRLDQIRVHQIETLKAALLGKNLSRKRVNNVLAVLGKLLRYAHEIEVLESVPKIKLLRLAPQKFDFFTLEELSRLLEPVKSDPERRALILTGADAGLRQGEMIALQWDDIDFVAKTLTVRRSSWRGEVGSPKSGRDRKIPLTKRLSAALQAHRHLRGELVFCNEDGSPITRSAVEAALRHTCKRAGLRRIGSHVLRHTFCSHLAMQGAAPKAVQELAGHSTLGVTLRYMHLAPSALREAIALLDFGQQMGNESAALSVSK